MISKIFMKQVGDLLLAKNGKLTEDLALESSALGLGQMPKRLMPDEKVNMTCGYCGTGCNLDIHMKNGEPVNVTPTVNYPVNRGEGCPKGWEFLTPLKAKDRATTPYLRNEKGKLEPVDWDTALKYFVKKMKEVQSKHGKESVAFLSTGQIPLEEMALLGALAKFGMGMLHGDGNTRQCMASAVVAYKQSFGFDAPPYTYKDFEESDVLIFVGANPCIAHPILWERVGYNQHNPKIIVIDPRKTETAMAADIHYDLEPKSDLVLFYGIAHILIKNNWLDKNYIKKHTNDFEDFKVHVEKYTPALVSQRTGLSEEKLHEFTQLIHEGKRVSFWWTMGVNQSHEGVRVIQAIINLTLMTGNIGRPGTGANSITGQCNAMGSRLFSNTTNLLGGHDFLNEDHRNKVADLLGIDPTVIPNQNSLAYDQIIEGIMNHTIKGLWVIATNPAHSWVNQADFKEYIGNLDFLVVQDMYHTTETAQIADLILPAACAGEKEGSLINSERRIGLFKKVAKAPGKALADFYIFKLIAEYWGCAHLFEKWSSPEDVFKIVRDLTKGQPCDITGIKDYKMIDQNGGIQWPFVKGDDVKVKERRLFENGKYYHADGKAKFIFSESRLVPEPTGERYPFVLLTGRGTSSQWHTQTRTSKSEVLKKLYPLKAYVEINLDDANRLKIVQGQTIYVSTRRGKVKVQASVAPTVKPGQLFMPMHYPDTNQLTYPSFDPYSRSPSYKHCAAQVTVSSY